MSDSPLPPASLTPEEAPVEEVSPPGWKLNLGLFLLTVLTTVVAGALQQGVHPLASPGQLYRGIPFSFTLLLILGAHETAHFLASRHHHLDVSLPYFLPAPPYPFIVGTFGAFIRIRSPIRDKRALLDVGCSGPLTGVAVALPVLYWGLLHSQVRYFPPGVVPGLVLGEPLFFKLVSWLVLGSLPREAVVVMHPVAFAGWIGLLVTALNLLPVGQLDGGHVVYALFPRQHRLISWVCLGVLILLGVTVWQGWLVWAGLLLLLGVRHPLPMDTWVPLDRRRRVLGVVTMAVFLLSFTPMPFSLD
jgi:membrane-associated protease RseP (regulator of RpoE activity)